MRFCRIGVRSHIHEEFMPHPLIICALALYSRERARFDALQASDAEALVIAGIQFQTADRCLDVAVTALCNRLLGVPFGGGQ